MYDVSSKASFRIKFDTNSKYFDLGLLDENLTQNLTVH